MKVLPVLQQAGKSEDAGGLVSRMRLGLLHEALGDVEEGRAGELAQPRVEAN